MLILSFYSDSVNYNAAQYRQNSQILPNPLEFAFLTILGVHKTPYLSSDVMALYLQLVLRNWVVSVQLFVVCSRGRNRWASFNTISSLKGQLVLWFAK